MLRPERSHGGHFLPKGNSRAMAWLEKEVKMWREPHEPTNTLEDNRPFRKKDKRQQLSLPVSDLVRFVPKTWC